MHRIDGPGATTDSKFTDGDPASATPATMVTDEWLNAIQEEVAKVIEDSGIELKKSSNAQLLAAINKKIASAIPTSSPQGLRGSFSNLRASATGSSAIISLTADQLTLDNGDNVFRTLSGVSLSINSASSGANGLDSGALAASNWYSMWAIWNGTTVAGLLSLSATAPTLPAGYTHRARVGWIRTDGTANKYPLSFSQFGRSVRYEVVAATNVSSYPVVASGAASSAVSASLTGVVPPTAGRAALVAGTANGGYVGFAPTGGFTSTPGQGYLSPSQLNGFPYAGGYNASSPVPTTAGEINLKNMSVMYCASGATSVLQCMGWEDNL